MKRFLVLILCGWLSTVTANTDNPLEVSVNQIHPQLPSFVFKFMGKRLNMPNDLVRLNAIRIYQGEKEAPIQVLENLDLHVALLADGGINFQLHDLNFDKYQDIQLIAMEAAASHPYHRVWFYEPEQQQFVESFELMGASDIKIKNPHKKTIKVRWQLDDKNSYAAEVYRFSRTKNPELIWQKAKELVEKDIYQLSVHALNNEGVLETQRKQLIRVDGRPIAKVDIYQAVAAEQFAERASQLCQVNKVLLIDNWQLYNSINAALKAVKSFESIEKINYLWVCPGEYYETISLRNRKNLYIHGENAHVITQQDEPIIIFDGAENILIEGLHVKHDVGEFCYHNCFEFYNANDIILRDNDIEGSGYYGIALLNVRDSLIENNQIHDCQTGVWASDTQGITLRNNRFFDNRDENVTLVSDSKADWNNWQEENQFTQPIEKDYIREFEALLQENAEKGDAMVQFLYALQWYREDDALTVKWLTKAAEKNYSRAQYQLAWLYYEGQGVEKNLAKAAYWFMQAAENGHLKSQHKIADMYTKGEGVLRNDAQAVFWKLQAAKQNDAKAQNDLAGFYAQGLGVVQDFAQAEKWATQAAEQGLPQAQFNLATMYLTGQGRVLQNLEKAVYWVKKAANQDYKPAQLKLSQLYRQGIGVDKDHLLARHWFLKAQSM